MTPNMDYSQLSGLVTLKLQLIIDESNLSKSSPDLAFLALAALNALARCLLAASCLALETLDLLEDETALELLRPLDLLEAFTLRLLTRPLACRGYRRPASLPSPSSSQASL